MSPLTFLVLDMIMEEEPFSALGFFQVTKATFMTVVSSLVAYLVVMVQFQQQSEWTDNDDPVVLFAQDWRFCPDIWLRVHGINKVKKGIHAFH